MCFYFYLFYVMGMASLPYCDTSVEVICVFIFICFILWEWRVSLIVAHLSFGVRCNFFVR